MTGSLKDLAHQCRDDSKRWFPRTADDLKHHVLGLVGEAGEVANSLKKADRGDYGDATTAFVNGVEFYEGPNDEWRRDLANEVTDVVVYAMNIFAALGVNPDVVYATVRANNERRFGRGTNGTSAAVL